MTKFPQLKLPFVARRGKNGVPVDTLRNTDITWWHVKPTGDFQADCETGRQYAKEFLEYDFNQTGPSCLIDVIRDMPDRVTGNGVEVGFMAVIGQLANQGWAKS